MKYFCTSETIANYLQKYIVYRKRKIFFGLTGKIDDQQLLAALSKHNKEKYQGRDVPHCKQRLHTRRAV